MHLLASAFWLMVLLTLATSQKHKDHAETFNSLDQVFSKSLATRPRPSIPSSALIKRLSTYPMANGWQLDIGTYDSMLPALTATATLQTFYNGVIQRTLLPTPRSHFYRFKSGSLALEFFCRQAPIPLLLVQSFANVMAAAARQGFGGKYEVYYTNVGQGITVAISLYVFVGDLAHRKRDAPPLAP